MQVWLNDELKQLQEIKTLDEALNVWKYTDHNFAVAINQEFIPRQQYKDFKLTDNDKIDIIIPMQGG